MVSYLTILFLGKLPGGSLPVLGANYLASNLQLALLESAEERFFFPRKNVWDPRIDLETAACEADTQLTASGKHLRTKVTPVFHLTYSKNGGYLG